ncbi:MAG: response regulator transcription factor [Gammaproteobacteria bacterium]|nr:response regulator transcription factor [Gammaproteobacteria bacterium]
MIKVLIADDHPVIRQGLHQILSDHAEEFIIGEAENSLDTLRQVRNGHWDVVVLDINMPGKSGLDALKQIRNEKPQTQVLVFTMYPEDHYGLRALKAGAAGYLTKVCAPDTLTSAILRVARGGRYITQSLAEKLASVLDSDYDRPPHEVLTDREFQIFNLLAAGKTVSEIAAVLALSVKTISTHRTKILTKMNLRNNAELMHYFMRNGLDGSPSPGSGPMERN